MSGLVMGMLVRVMTVFRILGFRPLIPTAATVPNTVAMPLASTDSRMELPSSFSSVRSLKSRTYCCKVKLSKPARLFPVSKEATISTAMGTYRKMKMRTVNTRLNFFMR